MLSRNTSRLAFLKSVRQPRTIKLLQKVKQYNTKGVIDVENVKYSFTEKFT